eukprot:CAMPEP_0184650016 /NCGR_PEP_ID=MMETSP0308-20130426/7495_1 /TAXON_ID=38269 /ORGANISM="Gloeochaete witrockiana, Strain SAG 46.84" /LENGTH=309 /DNA_ID=CAMNT_0027083219 /DNA_START=188 /DNA_END=1113 /DNA_ORIENTATION=-
MSSLTPMQKSVAATDVTARQPPFQACQPVVLLCGDDWKGKRGFLLGVDGSTMFVKTNGLAIGTEAVIAVHQRFCGHLGSLKKRKRWRVGNTTVAHEDNEDEGLNADDQVSHETIQEAIKTISSAAGSIGVILDVMKQYANVSDVQDRGCWAIVLLVHNNNANRVRLAEAGGIPVILNAMRRHGDEVGIQEKGCMVITALSFNSDANRISIAEAGCIPAILDAMRQHANVPDVQEHGCGAIGNLSSNNDANRVSFAKAGGIPAVVDAMRRHLRLSRVQDSGCFALANLADGSNEPNNGSIVEAGGIPVIL